MYFEPLNLIRAHVRSTLVETTRHATTVLPPAMNISRAFDWCKPRFNLFTVLISNKRSLCCITLAVILRFLMSIIPVLLHTCLSRCRANARAKQQQPASPKCPNGNHHLP